MAQNVLKSWNLEVLRDIYSNICLNSQSFLGFLTCFAHRPFVGCPFFFFVSQPVHLEFSQLHLFFERWISMGDESLRFSEKCQCFLWSLMGLLPSKPEGKVSDFLKVAPHLKPTKNLCFFWKKNKPKEYPQHKKGYEKLYYGGSDPKVTGCFLTKNAPSMVSDLKVFSANGNQLSKSWID